jgi:hypothetical protein
MSSLHIDMDSLKEIVEANGSQVGLANGKLILHAHGFNVEVGSIKLQEVLMGSDKMPFRVKVHDILFQQEQVQIHFQILER